MADLSEKKVQNQTVSSTQLALDDELLGIQIFTPENEAYDAKNLYAVLVMENRVSVRRLLHESGRTRSRCDRHDARVARRGS